MSGDWRKEFEEERERLNEVVLSSDHLGIKRFFSLDTQAYDEGALDSTTKELMGLASSLVLRCDDCVSYHITRCFDAGVTREQFYRSGRGRFDSHPAPEARRRQDGGAVRRIGGTEPREVFRWF